MSKIDKPVLVFVPGLGASGEVYNLLLNRLRETYDVRSADLPDDFPAELDWPFFYKSIETAARGVKRFYLLGHSMGGGIALKYAATHPDQVINVVTMSPVLFPFQRHRRTGRERLRNLWIAVRRGHPVHLLKVAKIIQSRATGGRAGKLYRFSGKIDLQPDLPKLHHATVLWPQREEVVPRPQFEEVRQRYPNVTAREVPGSHHTVALGPEPLIPVIEEALDG